MNKQEIEKAIGILRGDKEAFVQVNHGGFDGKIKAFELAISALEHQLTNGWIPVDRELPSSDGRFEVTIKGSKGKRRVEMCDFHKEAHGYKWGHRYDYPNVTAWRKRPEPWKEDLS